MANFGASSVRRLTTTGDLTEPITFDSGSGDHYLAKGPNDTLWVSLEQANKIGKVTGVSAPPPPVVTPPVLTTPPPPKAVVALHGHTFSVSGRIVSLPLTCQGASTCTGRITLRTAKAFASAKKKKRKLKLGSARFSIPAGQTKRVRIKLSKRGSALIRKGHSLKAVAIVGGKSSRVTLKRKR
jgi:hypothetical protein